MAVAALIKFVQGVSTPPAGQALIGATAALVTASNGDDSGVAIREWTMVDVPAGSILTTGVVGIAPTFAFTPDVAGGYHLKLAVADLNGNGAQDFRVFQVAEPSGMVLPPFDALAPSLNFGGQLRGWAPAMDAWLRVFDIANEVPLLDGDFSIDLGTFTRVVARTIDARRLPTTSYGRTLKARLSVVLESSVVGVTAEAQLYDQTNGVIVTGTTLSNSAAPSKVLPFEVTSGALTVGSSAGNIRRDAVTLYELRLRMSVGTSPDVAILRNARLRFTYE